MQQPTFGPSNFFVVNDSLLPFVTSLNSKISLNMMTSDANLVLTRVLGFQGNIPHSMQALFYSYLPFLDFFVHVVVFYIIPTCASFTLTYIKPLETLSSLVAY